ncbi:hypothetical protein cypCar_00022493 [Cyprinus carpio]|nr:hypothetical protein cypCar_00022493 [Cyprinus carpio]
MFPMWHTGTRNSWEGLLGPILPSQITAVTSLSAPGVTLLTGNWKKQRATDRILELKKPSCTDALVLRRDPNPKAKAEDEPFNVSMDEDSSLKDKRPVASTPIPGSPWCVVWTGDDRVFFFNPTMHLSVWEKPVDLKDRGDLNRIIEDPPHKRKKDSLDDGSNADDDDDDEEEGSSKTKRYKSTFKEFSEKYGNDPRFKQVLKRKDQELFFTQFISTLKKRDKENRIRLRKMR